MMTIAWAADVLQTHYSGSDVEFTHACNDSREVTPGALFIAIASEQVDGHQFVENARAAGAVAALVNHPVDVDIPQIIVPDTVAALGQLGKAHAARLPARVVILTGSCGKTTTKNVLTDILSQAGPTLSNQLSFNNHLGVPLTLLRMRPEHQFAVIEMGANHVGDIHQLVQLVDADVAILLNAGPVHLEGFGSIEGVARGKSEIFEGLAAKQGTAIINADDNFFDFWGQQAAAYSQISFGLSESADMRAEQIIQTPDGWEFTLVSARDNTQEAILLPLLGRHNILNALAASAAALALGVPLKTIALGLQGTKATDRRLRSCAGFAGATIIDDSYNANPKSVEAAMSVLATLSGSRILVLGDMGELGERSVELHAELGRKAKQDYQLDALYTVGESARDTAQAFGEGSFHFDDKDALVRALKKILDPSVSVLVKGSNFMKMHKIVHSLMEV